MKICSRSFLVLFSLLVSPLWAKDEKPAQTATPPPTNYEMIEAPTAYILPNGGYDFVTRIYEGGGLFFRANVGFKDLLMFGFSGNATNLIGNGPIEIQTPRFFIKFKVLDQKDAPVALGLGWDDRGYGTVTAGRFAPGLQKGIFAVVSHEFKEFGVFQLHGGVNVAEIDGFDSNRDLGLFAGTSFAVVPELAFNFEVDKILNDFWQFNANIVYNLDKPLRVGVDFREINRASTFSRIIRIQYVNFF